MPGCAPGDPNRLGATWDGTVTNLAVVSNVAEFGGTVTACVLADDGTEQRFALYPTPAGVWHGRISGLAPGQRYGFRAAGPYDPSRGLFFDPAVLLTDPYARALTPDPSGGPRSRHSVVVDAVFDWGGDSPPRIAHADSVIYETHVRGLTMQHPDVAPAQRGTFAALASQPLIEYLTGLGVTAVELMPVHEFVSEQRLLDKGLVDYWGYSTLGYFAPHSGYSSSGTTGQQVTEFRTMVKALHAAGIEVLLDVVYNHTAEGAPGQPALCWRGLANASYYRLDPDDPARYVDTTGTGNSIDPSRFDALRLITDSLRYWVQEMHVDGFRFDLAAELLRQHGSADRAAAFLDLLYQDPVLSTVKLIAEPWDSAQGDPYQLGSFPPPWGEWNDRSRDTIRRFWLAGGGIGELATRLAGSSDVFVGTRRGPEASINYVASHDGRTANDLVTYQDKHNEANGENNTDGPGFEFSSNFGVEGPTGDAATAAARTRAVRNLLLTLLLCQGTPMLLGGDERRRTQQGNTNAYCQDNPISWYDWSGDPQADDMIGFVTRAIGVRRAHAALLRNRFLAGAGAGALPDVTWFGRDGAAPRWDGGDRFLGMLLAGDATGRLNAQGGAINDDDVAVLVNGSDTAATVPVPGRPGASYTVAITTDDGPAAGPSSSVLVPPYAVVVATAPVA
jgi:isoamylase